MKTNSWVILLVAVSCVGRAWCAEILVPPKAEQIISFSSNPDMELDTGSATFFSPKKTFLYYLSHGLPRPMGDYWKTMLSGPATLPQNLDPSLIATQQAEIKGYGTAAPFVSCGGYAATAAHIYYWHYLNDWYLLLSDESGAKCVLDISKKPNNPGLYRNVKSENSLLPPSPQSIKLFSNSPSWWTFRGQIRVPVDKGTVLSFLENGLSVKDNGPSSLSGLSREKFDQLWDSSEFTVPKIVDEKTRSLLLAKKKEDEDAGRKFSPTDVMQVSGVMVSSSNVIYFWQLYSDHKLRLWNESGEEIYLIK